MRQKIMIVDDEPDLTRLVAHHLEREGFDPICTANGTEALQEIEGENIALMILDVMMPWEDGFKPVVGSGNYPIPHHSRRDRNLHSHF